MDGHPYHLLVVILATLAAGACYGKTTGPNYYTPEQIALSRQRIKTEDWAKGHVQDLRNKVAYIMKMTDEELWRFIPPAELTRATFLWEGNAFLGCPVHGKEIFEVGGGFYPWKYDREHPWKVQCPVGGL